MIRINVFVEGQTEETLIRERNATRTPDVFPKFSKKQSLLNMKLVMDQYGSVRLE